MSKVGEKMAFQVLSMTGYGAAEATVGRIALSCEIRSVNSKNLDLQLKMPQEYMRFEPELRTLVRERIARGRLDIFIRRLILQNSTDASVSADDTNSLYVREAFLRQVLMELDVIAPKLNTSLPPRQELLLALLGRGDALDASPVLELHSDEQNVLISVVSKALQSLRDSREAEGAVLSNALIEHLNKLHSFLTELRIKCDECEQTLEQRVRDGVAKYVTAPVDQNRLDQEIAFILERGDTSEELQRLDSHIQKLLSGAVQNGKELDFFCQELGRELHTLGAKSQSASVKQLLIEMRLEVEKIREQAQNVE